MTVTPQAQPGPPGCAPGPSASPGRPRTRFLIPVWNDLLSLVLCLPTVLQVADEVVLVDDASTDGSADYLRHLAAADTAAEITVLTNRTQQGWVRTRHLLMEHADPRCLRVWADADTLVLPERWPDLLAALPRAGALMMGHYEVWGDHRHTTHWGMRYDICHLAQWPGDDRVTGWYTAADGNSWPRHPPGRPDPGDGPLCTLHLNGYKTDERLAYKGRRLLEFNQHHQDGGGLERPRPPEPGQAHVEAMHVLFNSTGHRQATLPHDLRDHLEQTIPPELHYIVTGKDRHGDSSVTRHLAHLRATAFT